MPILEVQHPALESHSHIKASSKWQIAEAAKEILGIGYDEFMDTYTHDERLTIIAQYEIKWRIAALAEWDTYKKGSKT